MGSMTPFSLTLPPVIDLTYLGADNLVHKPGSRCVPERHSQGDFWPANVLHPDRRWCADCWGPHRCKRWVQVGTRGFACGQPTGGGDDCQSHFAASLAEDKAFARVES